MPAPARLLDRELAAGAGSWRAVAGAVMQTSRAEGNVRVHVPMLDKSFGNTEQ
jgi:hypothetical protein